MITLLFFLVHLSPGDPSQVFIDPTYTTRDLESLRHHWGLDRPLPEQYLHFLSNLLRGDLGDSLFEGRPVRDILLERLPRTLALSGMALILLFAAGIAIGTIAAAREGGLVDRLLTGGSLLLYCTPGFWLALMATVLFVDLWPLFPGSGMGSVGVDPSRVSFGVWLGDRLWHMILPAVCLAAGGAAGVARYVRGGVLDALAEDHVFAARARGLGPGRILFHHALRNALLPVVSLLGLYLPFLIGGSILIETVFAWPGMGRLLFDEAIKRDYPVVLGASFLLAAMAITGSLVADALYALVDPRVRRPPAGGGGGA